MPDLPEEAPAFESPLRNPSSLPEEAVQAAAEVLYRHYDSEYGADHLSWRDFTEAACEVVEAAAPAIAAQARADLLAAAQACTECGATHKQHPAKGDNGVRYMSWADPVDGHPYRQAGRAAAEWIARQIGEAP